MPEKTTPVPQDWRSRTFDDYTFNDTSVATKTLDFGALFQILKRQSWLIILTVIVVMGLAWLFILWKTPIYTASAHVAVESREKNPMEFNSVLSVLPRDLEAIQGEIELIQSRGLAEEVVEKLRLDQDPEFNPALARQDAAPSELKVFLKDMIRRAKQFGYTLVGKVEPASDDYNNFGSEKELLDNEIIDRFGEKLQVSQRGRSYVIEIVFSSRSPRRAAEIANAVAQVYIDDQLENRARATERANQWIKDRIVEVRAQTEAAERAAEQFRWNNGLVRSENSTLITQEITQLNHELTMAQVRRTQAEVRLKQAEGALSSPDSVKLSEELQSPVIQKLTEERITQERALAHALQSYGPRHPEVLKLRAQLSDLAANIRREISKLVSGLRNEVDVSVANEAAMLVKLEARKMTASKLSQADVRLRSLTADAEASRVLLNDLQQRYNETKLERDMQQAEARVISEAIIPKDPSSPNVRAITAVALAASLVLGILAALLREQMDSGFRTVEQLSALTGRPAFGELPAVSGGLLGKGRRVADLVTSHNAAFAEAVNSIAVRALMSPNAQPRSFLVTSTFPDEGKSVFCIALARTLARSGMKILLVDGDLRRPSLHRMMGLDEGPGLADIAKEDLSFDTVIQRDPISPVDLMASGMRDDTPLFHLGSSRTRAVLNRCSDLYDLVIIDSPPVDLVSDARLLAQTADETIYIVRWGSTPRDRVLYGLKELAETGARVSGVVLSRVSKSKSSKYSAADYAGGGRLPAQSRRVG